MRVAYLLVVASFLQFALPVMAEEEEEPAPAPQIITVPEQHEAHTPQTWGTPHVDVGLTTYNFNYTEDVPPPKKSIETGVMKGATVSGTFRLRDDMMFNVLVEGAGTTTLYDGSLQNGTPIQSDTENRIYRAQALVVRKFSDTAHGDFSGYAGLGFRFWARDIQGTGGYLEDYQMWTLPVGITYRHFFTDHFSVAPDLSARLLWGSVTAYLSKFGMSDLDLPLGSRFGFRVGAPITLWSLFGEGTSLVINPWYEFIGIGTGDSVFMGTTARGQSMYAREPASDTHIYGLGASVSFAL